MSKFNPLNHPICLSLPLSAGRELGWLPHAPFGMVLVDLLRPRVIVEVGGRDGVSYGAFCQAVMDLQIESRCFAISHRQDEDEHDSHEIEALERLDGFHDELYGGFSRRIQSSRSEALALFEDGTIDLLHIAPGISHPDARLSFETWLPKLSDRGVVLLSDINFHAGEGGLWKLWTEIKDDYPHFEFVHECGLGVISIGASPSDQIKQLLEAREPDVSLIREFFRQQGQRLKVRLEKDRELKTLSQQAQDRERELMELSAKLQSSQKHEGVLLKELDTRGLQVEAFSTELASTYTQLQAISTDLTSTRTQLQAILNSRAWRWVSRYGRLKMRLLTPGYRLLRSPFHNGRGPSEAFQLPTPIDPYDAWLEVNQWNQRRASVLRKRLSELTQPPLLSVIMPVYNPPIEFLDRAIQSVVDQVYGNWELCVSDDASTNPAVTSTLKRWADQDSRIKVTIRKQNGNISRATNSAAELANGEHLVFLDQDDELTPDALGEVVLYLADNPATDILYSDDDKVDLKGRRYSPQFKPDWSPELLLSYMYFSHLFIVRRSLFVETGGMRVGFEGSQDYDLALRVTEKSEHIGHIPKVLYQWRALPGSTATSGSAKPASFAAGLNAVQDAFNRRGIQASVFQPDWAVKAKCGIFSHSFPDEGPSVAIIIPTRNNLALLRACIDSIKRTTYKNYEVVVVDNESDEPATLNYLQSIPHRVLRISNPNGTFSFAAINNRAVEAVDADYILFLNDDTKVISPEWLSAMVGYLKMPGVGAVGARLLLPDGRIQHAGVVHGYYNRMVGPAFKLAPAADNGYLGYAKVTRNYSAVTAACMLTPRDLFANLGGFNEQAFAVAYNDVDYCYRLLGEGYRIVYCPQAEMVHHEGASRGFHDYLRERVSYLREYGNKVDPYYNPNLSLRDERFAIRARTTAPQKLEPIRTLMCAFNLNLEGAPHCQYELTVGLMQKGVIDPIVYSPNDGPLRQAYEQQGIRVRVSPHPLTGVTEVSDYRESIAAFASWIRDEKIELVYGNTLLTFYAMEAAHCLGLPCIWNPRESEPWETYFDFLPREIADRSLRCFAYPYQVVFVADATLRAWQSLNSRHNFMFIHDGLNREIFDPALKKWPRETAREALRISPGERVVLIMGTVCERKGQIDLVEAMGRLSEQYVAGTRCFIVGAIAPDHAGRLKQVLRTLPYSRRSRIEIVGETSDPALYYAASDIFVCCSRIESFPRVILEAMAAKLPIITTPVFGIAEQVKDTTSALFYSPGDVASLAQTIERLAKDHALREMLAANAALALESLIDFESMVDAYAEVFRDAWLSGATRARAASRDIA